RPRTPPAPPQAAWAPSTWVAAPLVSPITTREPPLGSLPHFVPYSVPFLSLAAHSVRSPPPFTGRDREGAHNKIRAGHPLTRTPPPQAGGGGAPAAGGRAGREGPPPPPLPPKRGHDPSRPATH